jgi:hypothetical protein
MNSSDIVQLPDMHRFSMLAQDANLRWGVNTVSSSA